MYISENTILVKGKVFEAMSPEDFFHFCQENENLNFERDENGNIIFMPPTGNNTGKINSSLIAKLYNWNNKEKSGISFDSSTGFTLPDGSQRSPDTAWMSNEKWNSLSLKEKEVFAPVCPEFIIELRSKSDRLTYLKSKMEMWINNGAHLAWLIDPIEQKAYIYRKDGSTEVIESFDHTLSGEDVLPEFELNLSDLFLS